MSKKPLLSLPSSTALPDDADENREIKLATYDVLLPCRRFDIRYKVAVLGRVSLTAEFLLRLLKSADGLDEGSAATFFGFDRRDMSFVLAEVESNGYVDRKDGKLWLTTAGQNLFRDGSDKPEIFEIERARENVAFDLLALAPERSQWMEDYTVGLPELKIADRGQLSDASARIPAAFRRFYMEIMIAKGKNGGFGNKRSIYSIDRVDAGDRFLVPVTIAVTSSSTTPWMGEADLSDWRSEQELLDRNPVGDAASAFVQGLQVNRRGTDSDAYRFLTDIAPEFLKEFIRTDGLAVERYYKEVLARRGQLRSDRPTIPVLGALTNKDNVERLIDAVSYASQRPARPSRFVWIKPQVPCWGATRVLPETLKRLKSMVLQDSDDQEAKSVCLVTGKPEYYLKKMFDEVHSTDQARFPAALEILLIPGFVAAAIVHAPVKVVSGHAVPLGVLSFDPQVVSRVQDFLIEELPAYDFADPKGFDELSLALSTPVLTHVSANSDAIQSDKQVHSPLPVTQTFEPSPQAAASRVHAVEIVGSEQTSGSEAISAPIEDRGLDATATAAQFIETLASRFGVAFGADQFSLATAALAADQLSYQHLFEGEAALAGSPLPKDAFGALGTLGKYVWELGLALICLHSDLLRDYGPAGASNFVNSSGGQRLETLWEQNSLGPILANSGVTVARNAQTRACYRLFAVVSVAKGLLAATDLIEKYFNPTNLLGDDIVNFIDLKDDKTRLQEVAQARGQSVEYAEHIREGTDHAPLWRCVVRIGGLAPIPAEGTSKAEAEAAAAAQAISVMATNASWRPVLVKHRNSAAEKARRAGPWPLNPEMPRIEMVARLGGCFRRQTGLGLADALVFQAFIDRGARTRLGLTFDNTAPAFLGAVTFNAAAGLRYFLEGQYDLTSAMRQTWANFGQALAVDATWHELSIGRELTAAGRLTIVKAVVGIVTAHLGTAKAEELVGQLATKFDCAPAAIDTAHGCVGGLAVLETIPGTYVKAGVFAEALQRLTQAYGQMPHYAHASSGPTHAPNFQATATWHTYAEKSHGPTKREARDRAAFALLTTIKDAVRSGALKESDLAPPTPNE